MNPVLPLLLALSLAALLLDRRSWGRALAVCGVAAAALLLPALVLPTGIPSPARSLAADAPWQAVADPAGGNPAMGDVTHQVYPWLLHLRRELRAGRLPLWNPYQSSGTPFWGNGSAAPLFPLHLLFAALPLELGFPLLPWLRIVAGGLGAWFLARELGVSPRAALLAALVYPLSAMPTSFLLYPMANALALVPWVLWATERLAAGRAGAAPLAALGGLQLLAGHPETALHTALLCAVYLAVRGAGWREWGRFAGGWALAAAIAAVQILPLALTLLDSSRWQEWHDLAGGPEPPLALLLRQPLRLVLPDLYGNPAAGTWWGPFNYLATAVYAGAAALPLAAAGCGGSRADRRRLAILAMAVFAFAAAYRLPGIAQVLQATPLLGRVLHHRLLFGVELGLALLAAVGLERWLAGRGRGLAAGALAALALLGAAWWLYGADWASRGLTGLELRWTLWAGAVALLAVASLVLAPARRARLLPLVLAAVALDLLMAHARNNPGQPLAELYPETPSVAFLRGRPERLAAVGTVLRPNAAMVYELYDARGDDSVKLASYERLHAAHLGQGHPTYFRPLERWESPWLDRLGVRWVLTGPGQAPPPAGARDWRLAHDGADARVYERPGALPIVRWEEGGADGLAIAERRPGAWSIDWRAEAPRGLVVAESFARGWRATTAGRELPVEAVEGVLLGVRLGPGEGRLELRHRPPGLALGAAASLAGLAAVGGAALWRRRR